MSNQMIFLPKDDGKTHINIYSKGKTSLGRFLSNFYSAKITTEDGEFQSIEGYWYWLSCNDDRLREVSGYEAKKLGRELNAKDWLDDETFKDKIRKAILIKLDTYFKFKEMLAASDLPLTHYYTYGDKVVDVPQAGWILDFLEFLRAEFKNE
jgi:hypothetical protein